MPVIGIVEVKRKEDFNDKGICQTIGYHIVSRVSNIKQNNIVPPLLILICQDQLKFIFLPFVSDGHHCIDAIVTPAINIFEPNGIFINESWFVCTCLYITGSYKNELSLMNGTGYNLTIHKKTYEQYMDIPADISELLAEKNELIEEVKRRDRELEQRDRELEQKDEIRKLKAKLKEPGQQELRTVKAASDWLCWLCARRQLACKF